MGLEAKVVGAYLSVWYADQPSECPLPVIVGLAERCECRTVGRTAQLQTAFPDQHRQVVVPVGGALCPLGAELESLALGHLSAA